MMRLLVFDRPFTSAFTRQYKALYGHEHSVRIVSDFKFRDDVGLVSRQYKHLRTAAATRELGLDYDVIGRRCRYLRFQTPQLQRRLVNSAWLAIQEVFESERPDAFIGLPMDNYYLDLIDQYCVANGIWSSNPVQSFLPERTRMTRRGELVPMRTPSEQEKQSYYEILLRKSFRPTWLSPHRTNAKLMKMYLREVVKKNVFASLKLLKRDPYSFHYNCVYPIGPTINTNSVDLLKIRKLFESDFEAVKKLSGSYRRAVFLPLQFSPESSLDYNIPDSRFSLYDKLLTTVIGNLPEDTLLIVKEHPDMYGYRRYSFYEKFLGRKNVVLVDVRFTVQQLFELCEYVLATGGASTGAEAVVKGKTVISLGGAFYGGHGSIHEVMSFDDVSRWPDWMVELRHDAGQVLEFVGRILSNTLVGPYDFVRISPDKIPAAQANIREIVTHVQQEVGARARANSQPMSA